ncbi:conserved hypothetical protein [Streptomyces sp. Mg1]|nr:conserved hypothetical protein [Streptomyces sp. Mg1]
MSAQGQITDRVGALGDRRPAVVAALDKLYADRKIQLFVTYVNDFSGRSAQSWADATAQKNGLGQDDVLLAVATGARQYAYSADVDSGFTEEQLASVARTAIEPALQQNDWAGAAIGAANGYDAVLGGQPVPVPKITPGEADPGGGAGGQSGAGDFVLPVVVVGAAGALGAFAYTRRRRKTGAAARGTTGWGAQPATTTALPLPELDSKAKALLVDTDDAVRTSTEELRLRLGPVRRRRGRYLHRCPGARQERAHPGPSGCASSSTTPTRRTTRPGGGCWTRSWPAVRRRTGGSTPSRRTSTGCGTWRRTPRRRWPPWRRTSASWPAVRRRRRPP